MECVQKLSANLLKFEKYSLNLETIVQYSEPQNFWNLFFSKGCKPKKINSPKSALKIMRSKLNEQEVYLRNAEWTPWFCYSQEEVSSNVSKSSRSKQSLYSYAEENDKKNKCVLFVFPEFQEPFYFFDLDDLQNDGLAFLVDPLKKVRFRWLKLNILAFLIKYFGF